MCRRYAGEVAVIVKDVSLWLDRFDHTLKS